MQIQLTIDVRAIILGFVLLLAGAGLAAPVAISLAEGEDSATAAVLGVPLGTAFTYQGRLETDGGPADGVYDFRFTLFDEGDGGTMVAGSLTVDNVAVKNGLFVAALDFGASAFDGGERWLAVEVAPGDSQDFELLEPRQLLTATPYALFATSGPFWKLGGNGGTDPGTDFLGTSDNTALELRVNNTRALRITPSTSPDTAPSIVGGHATNIAEAGGFIGGGGKGAPASNNYVLGTYGTIAGGFGHIAGMNGFVGGGSFNVASESSVVAGGTGNYANGVFAVVGGGQGSVAAGSHATVSGGFGNVASGDYSAALGGRENLAGADYSVALGHSANLAGAAAGSFLFSDITSGPIQFTTPNTAIFDVDNGLRLIQSAGDTKSVSVGHYYRDNAIIAWAKILNSGGTPTLNGSENFNVTSVSKLGTGQYRVTIGTSTETNAHLLPVAIAEIDGAPATAAATRIVSINQQATNSFDIYVQNGNFALVDNDVTFIVTGR